jgi:hypothetical protein
VKKAFKDEAARKAGMGACCPRHGMVCMVRQQFVVGDSRVCRVAMAALTLSNICTLLVHLMVHASP